MNLPFLLLLSILPVLLILLFVYKKDKNKEPLLLLFIFFCSGIFSCFLVLQTSNVLATFLPFMNMSVESMGFFDTLLYTFIGVALVEEICKWIMVYFIGYYHKEFEEMYDILVYAVFVSLGFAFYENIMYVLALGDLKTVLLRAISAIPGHACDAIFMGYYLSVAKIFRYKRKKDLEKNNIYLSIIVPALLHGIYDFCLLSGYRIFIFVFIFFVTYLYIISYDKIKEMARLNTNIKNKSYEEKS